ncbi:MAG: CDP-alcohol phosphatidyltransferase family protein [Bacteroidetes bacterium]|nr:CDP-alcohol phosphatidyltransferase family protein [Bacteroidota bacterium]
MTNHYLCEVKLFSIPNLLTLGNLLCGCLAIVFAFEEYLVWSAYLVGIACVFDFLDGFVARALKINSPIGKDLDSLADMVTFGVVPGVVMFQMINVSLFYSGKLPMGWGNDDYYFAQHGIASIAFLITIFSALRLAKFNNDTRQSESFIGLPTPANSIFICSLPLILNIDRSNLYEYETQHVSIAALMTKTQVSPTLGMEELVTRIILNPWFLIGVTVVMSLLLILELPLFALKFKSFSWKGNEIRYIFLLLCAVMLVLLKFVALPMIIVLYILMSVGNNIIAGRNKI